MARIHCVNAANDAKIDDFSLDADSNWFPMN